jgi:hypothetical protein
LDRREKKRKEKKRKEKRKGEKQLVEGKGREARGHVKSSNWFIPGRFRLSDLIGGPTSRIILIIWPN